jgi:hypothetical protein
MQPGAAQIPFEHTPDAQSAATVHLPPLAQVEQVPPPQSTSVSVWFLTLSVQVAFWQTPPVQTPEEQSLPTEQALVSAQVCWHDPPQSTSASLPFFTPSVHDGG